MSYSLTPTQIGNYRCTTVTKHLNFKQSACTGPCKMRRSIGQFNHHPAICDRCYNRMPKPA